MFDILADEDLSEKLNYNSLDQSQYIQKRERRYMRLGKYINASKEIVINSLFLWVYAYQLYLLKFSARGACYANDSYIPKFDYPEKISTPDLNLGF